MLVEGEAWHSCLTVSCKCRASSTSPPWPSSLSPCSAHAISYRPRARLSLVMMTPLLLPAHLGHVCSPGRLAFGSTPIPRCVSRAAHELAPLILVCDAGTGSAEQGAHCRLTHPAHCRHSMSSRTACCCHTPLHPAPYIEAPRVWDP